MYIASFPNIILDPANYIQHRIRLASSAVGQLVTCILLKKSINIRARLVVYNAICVSILLYGCESWIPYRHHIKMLELFHISLFLHLFYTGDTVYLILRYVVEQIASY